MLQLIKTIMYLVLTCLILLMPNETFAQEGMASYYGTYHHGRKTASGERYNMYGLSAAHRTLPLRTKIRVTDMETNKSIIVVVNDRGPYHGNRILDLSQGAARKLGIIKQGVAKVKIDVLSLPEKPDKLEQLIRKLERN